MLTALERLVSRPSLVERRIAPAIPVPAPMPGGYAYPRTGYCESVQGRWEKEVALECSKTKIELTVIHEARSDINLSNISTKEPCRTKS